jgi:hypothetical protein
MKPGDPTSTVLAVYSENCSGFDHEDWNNSPPVLIKHQWSGSEAPSTRHAETRLCWNERGLIVRFVGEQHEPLIVAADPITDRKTIGLWDRDVCEIFIAPDEANINHYFEFEAAPTGEWIDLALQITSSGRETDWDYSSGMTTLNRISAERIEVMIMVPWSERIPEPAAGDQWRVNLFRCIGPDEATRYLAWRPTRTPEPNFHVPDAFGILRFE